MNQLPTPNHPYGYPSSQLAEILKELKISKQKFEKAFGVNTCSMSETGETIYYPCDVERALYKLGHKLGINNMWD
jgi:hypothetical protein